LKQKELDKLRQIQQEIEETDWTVVLPNKPRKYYWEHELGWLDLMLEIDLIERENMPLTQLENVEFVEHMDEIRTF
jgi:hypothetical protein